MPWYNYDYNIIGHYAGQLCICYVPPCGQANTATLKLNILYCPHAIILCIFARDFQWSAFEHAVCRSFHSATLFPHTCSDGPNMWRDSQSPVQILFEWARRQRLRKPEFVGTKLVVQTTKLKDKTYFDGTWALKNMYCNRVDSLQRTPSRSLQGNCRILHLD
jgi:hypothetical protein